MPSNSNSKKQSGAAAINVLVKELTGQGLAGPLGLSGFSGVRADTFASCASFLLSHLTPPPAPKNHCRFVVAKKCLKYR